MNFDIREAEVKAEVIKSVREDRRLANVSLRDTSVFMIIVSALSRAILFAVNPILKDVYESIFIQTANKYNLQRKLLEEGLSGFKPPQKAKVDIKMGSSVRPAQRVDIAQGLIIKTSGDDALEFELLNASFIDPSTPQDQDGSYTVSIEAQAALEGPQFNVREGTLREPDQEIDGIDIITNPEPALGGSDEESIESVRERLLTRRTGRVVGTLNWFRSEAESILNVRQAKVIRG